MREKIVFRMMNLLCIFNQMKVPKHLIDVCFRITGPLIGIFVQIFYVSFFPTLRVIKRIKIIAHLSQL